MTKRFLLAALLLLQTAPLPAQENYPVLWEISGNGIKKPSYLFGTIHVAPISLLDSFPQIMRIAERCDFALFENGGSPIGTVPVRPEVGQPPLDSIFTPEEYAVVDSFFTASPHGSIRPHNDDADLLAMLQVAITMNESNANAQYDVFDHLLRFKLYNLNKPIFQLDVVEDIEEIKNRMGYRNVAKMLAVVITSKSTLKEIIPQESRNHEMYFKKLRYPLNLHQEPDENIAFATVKRNADWLPKIETQIKNGSCFIAVGLEHLRFRTGLVQLLKKQGYTLKPVNP
ncbi:TraB/GumN family protein [Dyadobacter sp. 676]|uniref:TraB/GumN family protein n=1 Tax=Dyadobacter sp. 676 TaxID=3088362 RepID=A0AAU8FHX0_9BACT